MLLASHCPPEIPEDDPFTVRSASIENGVLNVEAEYGLGCFDAVFSPCAGDFQEGEPPRIVVRLFMELQAMDGEGCNVDIAGNASLAIDLSWIEDFFNGFFMEDGGDMTIILRDPFGEVALPYSF